MSKLVSLYFLCLYCRLSCADWSHNYIEKPFFFFETAKNFNVDFSHKDCVYKMFSQTSVPAIDFFKDGNKLTSVAALLSEMAVCLVGLQGI